MSVNTTELCPQHLVTKTVKWDTAPLFSTGTLHCPRHQTPARALHKTSRNCALEVAYRLLDLCHKAVQKEKHIL